jgi:hypothetical protein
MKYIKLFETWQNISSILPYLEERKLKDIPMYYRMALATYLYDEDGETPPLDEVYEIIEEYEDNSYYFGNVPLELLLELIIPDNPEYSRGDFEQSTYATKTDKGEVFAILADCDDEEFIIDGWHRLGRYYREGRDIIPILIS